MHQIQSALKPGLGLRSISLLLFILKSRKMKSGKKINRKTGFTASWQIMHHSVLFLCFPVPPQETHCFHKHLLISHQHSCPIRERASLVFWTDKEWEFLAIVEKKPPSNHSLSHYFLAVLRNLYYPAAVSKLYLSRFSMAVFAVGQK